MNRQLFVKPALLGALMLIAAGLTIAATPTKRMVDLGPKIDLEQLIPEAFGEWHIDRSIAPITVAPDVQAKLDRIYNQTLSRTYVNSKGQRVMLSIAYGGDQSDATRAHRPEACYPAQGFKITSSSDSVVNAGQYTVPAKSLVAQMGARIEPITYWIMVGERVATSGTDQKLMQLSYTVRGVIPDGMLVRVSNISPDARSSYDLHSRFVSDLAATIPAPLQPRFFGATGSSAAHIES